MQLSSSTSCSSRLLGGVKEYTVEKKLWWMVRACIVGVGVTRRWTDNVPWGFLYHQRADGCCRTSNMCICPPQTSPPDLGQSSWASALAARLQRTVSMWPKQRTSLIWPASEKLASQERIWLNWTKPDICPQDNCPTAETCPRKQVQLTDASAYRLIGRYRRSKHRQSRISVKIGLYAVATTNPNLNTNPMPNPIL